MATFYCYLLKLLHFTVSSLREADTDSDNDYDDVDV